MSDTQPSSYEQEICPICHKTSCGGPSEHQPARCRPVARIEKRIATRQVDWRYVKFNLATAEGQRGYSAYVQVNCKSVEQVAGDLFQHERSQVIEASQYWIAEAIVRKMFGLPSDESFVKRDSLGQPKPESIDLFV